jgi:hypothetical protein
VAVVAGGGVVAGCAVGGGGGAVVVVVAGAVEDVVVGEGVVADGAVVVVGKAAEDVVVEDGVASRAAGAPALSGAVVVVIVVVVVVVGLGPLAVVDGLPLAVFGQRVVVVRGAVVVARSSVVVARVPRALDSAPAAPAGTVVGAWTTVRAGPALNAVVPFCVVDAALAARSGGPATALGSAAPGEVPSCCATAFTIPLPTGGPVGGRSAAVSAATWD